MVVVVVRKGWMVEGERDLGWGCYYKGIVGGGDNGGDNYDGNCSSKGCYYCDW